MLVFEEKEKSDLPKKNLGHDEELCSRLTSLPGLELMSFKDYYNIWIQQKEKARQKLMALMQSYLIMT